MSEDTTNMEEEDVERFVCLRCGKEKPITENTLCPLVCDDCCERDYDDLSEDDDSDSHMLKKT